MKERPILFSGAMVRAIRDGRKTQTRRVVVDRAEHHVAYVGWLEDGNRGPGWYAQEIASVRHADTPIRCPYGGVGDRLWVRETYCPLYFGDIPSDGTNRHGYRADFDASKVGDVVREPKWTPAIFMRRDDSRITLEVTGVRVERLLQISEEDASSEGVEARHVGEFRHPDLPGGCATDRPAAHSFLVLWESNNGKRVSWQLNPWVWAITFKRVWS